MSSKRLRPTAIATIISLGFCLWHVAVLAQNSPVDRPYEPVIMEGINFSAFSGNLANVNELFLFAYDATLQTWQQIPFQIDQIDALGSFFGATDNLLDDNDQLVFMARDAGDRAPANAWIGDAEARQFARYEIQVNDPLEAGTAGWLYLYRSSTLAQAPGPGYMSYVPPPANKIAADAVIGASYYEGHSDTSGLANHLHILTAAGGNGLNILDRQKVRIRTEFKTPFGTIRVTFSEDNFRGLNLFVREGPVRILREVEDEILLDAQNPPLDTARVLIKFYPYSLILSGRLPLDPSLAVALLRVSIDLNSNASGMAFYNHSNSRKIVNATADNVDRTVLPAPALNWDLITGAQGSLVKIIRMNLDSLNNATPAYYYQDAPSGTDDGTVDTGDMKSYGDSGIKLTGSGINGTFPIFFQNFFLAANQDSAVGPQLLDQVANPLTAGATPQSFDAVAPARVQNLAVAGMTETSILLAWTAPGDDGTGNGPVSSYTLYFSTTPVASDTAVWAQNQATAIDIPNPAAAPGQTEQYTVTALSPQNKYYFLVVSQDDFGNISGYSNVASGLSVPVELASFQANVEKNRVSLLWQTASESNNAGFQIERKARTDADNAWQEIGFVPGNGTTNSRQSYSFTDKLARPGVYGYRLRQTDFDGTFSYSPVRDVQVSVPTQLELMQNYPNPIRGGSGSTLRYTLPDGQNREVKLRLFNTLGQEIGTLLSGRGEPGYYEINWDGRLASGTPAPAGIYFLILESGSEHVVRKMTILP